MTNPLYFRIGFCVFCGLLIAWTIRDDYRRDGDSSRSHVSLTGRKVRYLPYISGQLLPLYLVTLLLLGGIFLGPRHTVKNILSLCVSIFPTICLYYLLLLPLLPFLRRRISARACAALWMVPNFLYLLNHELLSQIRPGVIISLPGQSAWVLLGIWAVGFVAVMGWKTVQHLQFRRQILADSRPLLDNHILYLWRREREEAGLLNHDYPLLVSPHVKTPLTIGLYRWATKVVLPERSYTDEELSLILRHEIVHIARQDAWNKFFLVFCTAMCWFNPLLWIAMGRSAEDLELSCDETVLLGVDDATRKQYASLLLDTAGDSRGYSTCLAASAAALRYRLKAIVQPTKRRSGALLVGLVFALLAFVSGNVVLAYNHTTGADVLYGEEGAYHVDSFSVTDQGFYSEYSLTAEDDLRAFLSQLQLSELTGSYNSEDSSDTFSCFMRTPDGLVFFALYDHLLKVQPLMEGNRIATTYYIEDGVDWDALRQIVVKQPSLKVSLYHPERGSLGAFQAHLSNVWKLEDEQRTVLYENIPEAGEKHGVFWSDKRHSQVTLQFSQTLAAPYRVEVQAWDHTPLYTLEQAPKPIIRTYTFPLEDQYAHYIVHVSFYGDDGILREAEYRFDIGPLA